MESAEVSSIIEDHLAFHAMLLLDLTNDGDSYGASDRKDWTDEK